MQLRTAPRPAAVGRPLPPRSAAACRRAPAPPPSARRPGTDAPDWREVLASKRPQDDDDDDGEDYVFVADGDADGDSAAEGEEVLFSIDGGWHVEAVEEEEEEDGDDPQSWSAGPAFERDEPAAAAPRGRPPPPAPASASSLLDLDALPPTSALASIPRHVLASLLAAQDAADDAGREASARGRAARDHSTHSRIALLGGAARGVRLLSGRGDNTRPMMAKVKAALFDMLLCGSPAGPGYFPDGATWLDLFAGTGSVGLEAVSRGAARAEFVEMDPWVVANVLSVNAAAVLSACDGGDAAAAPASTTRIHTMTAQAFLASHTGPGFDYVSVCPPYVKVEYGELLRQVEASNVLHAHSVVVVEYPARAAGVMPATLGGLERVRDRRYGRTNVAVYGPGG